jgi:hypothetical protein
VANLPLLSLTNIVTQMPHELVPAATTIARLLDPTGRDFPTFLKHDP